MINKPVGVISATRRGREEGTLITELVGASATRLFPVGRLDRDSEGLMLLTNDGDLALRLSHPRYEREKEYEVQLDRPFVMAQALRLTRGVKIDGVRMHAVRVHAGDMPRMSDIRNRVPGPRTSNTQHSMPNAQYPAPSTQNLSSLRIVLAEGHKRQIRRMFSTLGYTVTKLRRTRIARLELGDLKPGEWRQLTPTEIDTKLRAPAPRQRRAMPGGTRRTAGGSSRRPTGNQR